MNLLRKINFQIEIKPSIFKEKRLTCTTIRNRILLFQKWGEGIGAKMNEFKLMKK